MKEVLARKIPKDSFTLVVSDSSANIQTTFDPPLYLLANRNYELAIGNLDTYYSFANIRGDNNSFKWSVDDGKTWTILHVPGEFDTSKLTLHFALTTVNIHCNMLPFGRIVMSLFPRLRIIPVFIAFSS